MVTLRCTKKLLNRIRVPEPMVVPAEGGTTALGDWYATLLFVRPKHLALFVSEPSRLAVLLEAAPLSSLTPRFRVVLREVLLALEIPEAAITKEESAMEVVCFGPTQSRSVLGTMNEYVKQIDMLEGKRHNLSLVEQSLLLNGIICKPLRWQHPAEVARQLLVNE